MPSFAQSIGTALQLPGSADPVLWSVVARSLAVSGLACSSRIAIWWICDAWVIPQPPQQISPQRASQPQWAQQLAV